MSRRNNNKNEIVRVKPTDRYIVWARGKDSTITIDDMHAFLSNPLCKPQKEFKVNTIIETWNRMDRGYTYTLQEEPATRVEQLHTTYLLSDGKTRRSFTPALHPKTMLSMGIFGGKYMNDCMTEFPREWFTEAIKNKKLSPNMRRPDLNFYGVDAGQPLPEWQRKNWMVGDDNRGWFQWYCRYALGRRDREVDRKQMQRWGSYQRFYKNPRRTDKICQGLLHWSYESD